MTRCKEKLKAYIKVSAYIFLSLLVTAPVSALSPSQIDMFSQNNIIFYDPDEDKCLELPNKLHLSEDQKIAATFIVGFGSDASRAMETVTKYKIGGLYVNNTKHADQDGYTKSFYEKLTDAAGHPLIIANDNEGGQIYRDSYAAIESAASLGGKSEAEIINIVKPMAEAMKANGQNTNLAPVLDLTGVGASDRNFSTDASVVIKKADAFAQVLVDADITPTFKHFPGFDSSVAGQNTDLAKVTLSTNLGNLESKNIAPYKALLAKYPDSHLMMSNLFTALDPGNMASTSKATVDYVRGTLGFGGVIMTDSLTGPAGYLWPTAFLRMPPPRNTKRKLKIG